MADSQPESNIFSVRIVSIDYYMSPPVPDMDICYSSFQGGTVNEVPIVRIYGSTPAGQKTCLHIHRALPYLYVPCADILSQTDNGVDAYTHAISLSIEKALKLKGNAASKRQHVHGCSLVRAKRFYGYHASEELFVKIYLYHPQDVSRAANLLLGGAVLDGVLQPHESHIPFLLQFLVDYNLCGMGHVHLSKMKFRPPIPDVVSSVKAKLYKLGKDTEVFSGMSLSPDFQTPSGDPCLNPPVWTSSTLPGGWLWQSGELKESRDKGKRLSTCELEGDATIDEILNQQSKLYTSLSQTCSDVKMVQSLIPTWEEEYERTGMHGAGILLPDPGKPSPQDVLRTFSLGLYFESKLTDLCNEGLKPLEKDEKLMLSIKTDQMQNLADHVTSNTARETSALSMERKDLHVSQDFSSEKDYCASGREGKPTSPNFLINEESQTSDPKASDKEAIGLLRWLVSSQAAEDINSDDEVVYETILSPMLTALSIDKVLERANKDFESESQQECQDILDSIEDFANFEVRKKMCSILYQHKPQEASSEKRIPHLYSEDQITTPCVRNTCGLLLDTGNKMHFHHQELQNEGKNFTRDNDLKKSSQDSLACASHTELSKCAIGSVRKRDDSCHGDLSNNVDDNLGEEDMLVGCSLRDLMRRKRSYKVEPSECEADYIKSYFVDDQRKAGTIIQKEENAVVSINQSEDNALVKGGTGRKSLESFNSSPSVPQQTNVNLLCDPKSSNTSYGKLPLLSKSKNSLWSDMLMVKKFDFHERDDNKSGFRVCVGTVNLSCRCSPEGCSEKNDSSLILNSKQHCFTVSTGHFENDHKKENECMATPMITMNDNDTSSKSVPSVASSSFIKCNMEHKVIGDERMQQTDAAGFDILSTCPVHQETHVAEDRSGQNTISMESVPEMVSDIFESTDEVTSTAVHFENSRRATEMAMCLTDTSYFMSPTRLVKEESVELTVMTFFKKPPTAELADGRSENALLPSTRCTYYTRDEDSNDRGLDELLPFYLNHSRPDVEIENKLIGEVDPIFHHGTAMGIPIHLHNDGSCLYMLTPAFTPPTADSIGRWLLHDETDVSGTNFDATVMESSSLKGCSSVLSVEGSRDEACTKLAQNYDYGSNTRPIQDQLKKQSIVKQNKKENAGNDIVKVKALSDCSQDISQISGPDRNLKPTPFSQIGFRDPASVGGGQQLTSVSIEILAECRGVLRPDPRYDAISVIAIAIEDDTDSIPVLYLLLRCIETCQRNQDGISDCTVVVSSEERQLFLHFVNIISLFDPDILLGWDIQGGSLGFLAERAAYLGIGLLNKLSRMPSETGRPTRYSEDTEKDITDNVHPASTIANSSKDTIIEDEWGRTHASGVHVGGRIVLNIWRLMRGEIKLNMYSVEAVAEGVLRRKIPSIRDKVLMKWLLSGPGQARYRCMEYMLNRAKLNLEIVNQLDMINRTSELARVFGIDFFSVLSRGSQYRVESMLLRLARTQNYIAISPGNQQVASQLAMECIPLVMEPESGFYADPVIVLDFQSLYPSMIIAYNLCFSTCLGKVSPSKTGTLGVSSYSPDQQVLRDLKTEIMLTPNGVMYVPPKVRKGVLPRLLEEILSTRIMVKQAMKKLSPSQKVLQRIFDSRQLALKLIANVTCGYTAAGFSGRMPCAELADSIVQCGRLTLETAISFVNAHDKWKARVIYGDTDSMFVLLKGRNVKEAFHIGQEIVSAISAMNPVPVTLKLEKVYHPCFLITKKRYVGFSYESPDQVEPLFDAKGIETVRRDTCTAVAKTLEQSLRLFFKHQDILEVKSYLQRQWTRILSGRVSLQDFVFAKEVRLGTYSSRTSSSLPPAAIVAIKAMKNDPRAEPRYGERVPYIVIHGEPGARLVDMVVDPFDLLTIESPFRLNDLYYINKQITPALQRLFGLVGADLNKWFSEMPRPIREALGKRNYHATNPHRTRIDYYYLSKHCLLCGELVQASARYCSKCSENKTALVVAVTRKTSKLEREMQHLAAICRHCGGGDWLIESGVKCTSLACSVFFERRKVQKELLGLSTVATESGYYPPCMIEWF